MRRTLVWTTAGLAVLFAVSFAWSQRGGGGRAGGASSGSGGRTGGGSGSIGGGRIGGGSIGGRPVGGAAAAAAATRAKADARRTFETIRSRSPADAARYLREQAPSALSRSERAALLNGLASQILRQQRLQQSAIAARLGALRQLRADWVAVGPGAGLDPLVELELAAAESAAERLALTRALGFVDEKLYAKAAAELAPLADSRHLPVPVANAVPGLRSDLLKLAALVAVDAAGDLPRSDAADGLPADVKRAVASVELVRAVTQAFISAGHRETWTLHTAEGWFRGVEQAFGADAAGKVRVELSAALLLAGHRSDALELLGGQIDAEHARGVLADLRTVVVGGQLVNAQIAKAIPADTPPVGLAPLVPADARTTWKPPAAPTGATTTLAGLEKRARKDVASAVAEAVGPLTGKVEKAAGALRAELAKHAGPLGEFGDRVKARLGRPVNDDETELVAVAAVRGLAVDDAVALLAADADRPAQAARLVGAAVGPAFLAQWAVAARPPVSLTGDAGGGFRLPAEVLARDRAKVREAAAAILATLAQEKAPPAPTRAAFEAAVAKGSGLPDGQGHAVPEVVAALHDAVRDLAAERVRLAVEWRDLNEAVGDLDERYYSDPKDRETIRDAKARRDALARDANARGRAVTLGVGVLAEYGPDAAPALPWLRAAAGGSSPWKAAASDAVARVTAKP